MSPPRRQDRRRYAPQRVPKTSTTGVTMYGELNSRAYCEVELEISTHTIQATKPVMQKIPDLPMWWRTVITDSSTSRCPYPARSTIASNLATVSTRENEDIDFGYLAGRRVSKGQPAAVLVLALRNALRLVYCI